MKILITGGAGFIGSNLCEHFVGKGHDVTCLDNLSTGFPAWTISPRASCIISNL